MQTINFDIGQLLKKIRSGHFLIPQFQRDFTWKEGQTRLLIDSIARNYPVGSLLILGKNEEVPLKSRKLDAIYPPKSHESEQSCDFDEPSAESYYVLDGQQRLTSIARVFLDAHPNRNYYFDLKKMYEIFNSESPSWIVSRARGIKNPDRKDNNKGVAIFAKDCFGHPSPSNRQKLNATNYCLRRPSRPAPLVSYPTRAMKHSCAMTRRDVGMLCNFTTQTTLREIAQPYRFWGLKIFTSLKLRFQDFQRANVEYSTLPVFRSDISRLTFQVGFDPVS